MRSVKRPLYFPRCLVCDRVLFLRDALGRKRKIVKCDKCKLQYSRAAIKDADPERWDRVRTRDLYTIKKDSNNRPVLLHDGLGSRRVAQ